MPASRTKDFQFSVETPFLKDAKAPDVFHISLHPNMSDRIS